MLKKYHMVISLAIIFIVGSIFIIKFNANFFFENPLKNIAIETQDTPNYVSYGTLYSSFGRTDLRQVCYGVNEEYNLLQIFCVFEKKVYFVYGALENENYGWEIGSYNLETFEFQSHCMLVEPQESYRVKFEENYFERNGYYLDGQIVLTDHKNVLIYNIVSNNSKIYDYEEYDFPQYNNYGEYIDSNIIKLTVGNNSKSYTLEEIAYKSDAIKEIFNLRNMKIWNGKSSLYNFFSENCIQAIEDKVYISGRCLNFFGESYAVVLEYNTQDDSWKYVANCHVEDILIERFYVIP